MRYMPSLSADSLPLAIPNSYEQNAALPPQRPIPISAYNSHMPTHQADTSLRQALAEHFSLDELKAPCFDAGIDHHQVR